jgi:hypothetical protein
MAIITPKLKELNSEQAIEYLEAVGEWHTVRNVPGEIMIKWANYLRNRELFPSHYKNKNRQDCVEGIYETPVKK